MARKHLPGRHNQQDHADGRVANAADKLGLAMRIVLGPGERLVSSARLPVNPLSSRTAVLAVTRDDRGPHVRLGFVAEEHARTWAGANRGGTVLLDGAGTTRLDATLVELERSANAWGDDFRALADERDEVNSRRSQLLGMRDRQGRVTRTPEQEAELELLTGRIDELNERWDKTDGDAVIAQGIIPGGDWGDIAYHLAGTDDSDGGWELQLAVRPADAPAGWNFLDDGDGTEARFGPQQIRVLRQRLAATREGKAAATDVTLRGGRVQFKSFQAGVKEVADEGTVLFVLATLNEIDKDGDVTLPGYFGQQPTVMVPVHDWNHVPIGKGRIFEDGDEAIAEMKLNLDIAAARDWHAALKFDMANPPALQQYSYGYTVLDGGSERGQHKGRSVRFLKARPDGTPGAIVHEVSPVLLGAGNNTRTLGVKSATNRFADEAQAVVAAVRALSERAADVMAKRQEKGPEKGLGTGSTALLQQVEAELKHLSGLLAAQPVRPQEPDTDEIARIVLRDIARRHR